MKLLEEGLMWFLLSFAALGPGALRISSWRTQFQCIALYSSLLPVEPRTLCHPQNSISSCIKQEHISILITHHSTQNFIKEHKWGNIYIIEGGRKHIKAIPSGRYADQRMIFFETWRCKYLYFVDKIPEARRQTLCTHNLRFSLLYKRVSHTTVSWWCARWCPPFLRMGEVELVAAPPPLPAQELEGRGVRWEGGASAEGNPEAEETKGAAPGTWNLWWSICWQRGRGSWRT